MGWQLLSPAAPTCAALGTASLAEGRLYLSRAGAKLPQQVPEQEGAGDKELFPPCCAQWDVLGKALPCSLGCCRLYWAVAPASFAGSAGVWGLWTHLQSWRVLVLLSRTILD